MYNANRFLGPLLPVRHDKRVRHSVRRQFDREQLGRMRGDIGLRRVRLVTLRIHHRTTYRYHRPVRLGLHRLMLRPRESQELHLVSSNVFVTRDATVSWALDVFGNAVATATFQTMTDALVVDGVAELQLSAAASPIFDIAASAISYPFRYSDDEWIDLGA